MSVDIITNGDFIIPDVSIYGSNYIQYYSTFTQGEKDILGWVCSDNISLQSTDNGATSFGYTDITLLNGNGIYLYQYVSIENTASISQTMNFTKTGSYTLSFLYCARPNYQLNNLQIFLNYKLLDVITVSQSYWTQYNYTFQISTLGSYSLSFQGQGDYIIETHIAISHIQLYAPTISNIGTIAGVTVYNNNFKSSIINGTLSVIDYTISGNITKGELTTNYFTCKNNLTLTKAINFSDGSTPISSSYFGRIMPSATQLLFDYYSVLSFRQCADKAFGTPVYKLNQINY